MRLFSLSALSLAVALSGGCGPGTTDTNASDSSSAGTTSTTSGTTGTSGTTTGTTGTMTGTSGTTSGTTGAPTTGVDPTGVTSVSSSTGGENCDPGYSAGCCFGDGECCPCVGFDCDPLADAAAIEAFQGCACQLEVCADACAVACAGGGIDNSCFVCADKAGQTTCQQEFAACGGHLDASCDPPEGCPACEYCALTGECYDAWFACWSDVGGCQNLVIQCEPMCGQDPGCLQTCADAFPMGPGLYQAYLDCVYCDTCAGACGDAGVSCGP